jgi:Protein of unknown function (DUF3726)
LPPPPETLDLSINEVEGMAQKAARGAGLPWGVAEDTGRAAAWLARRVGAWAGQLLALLEVPPPRDESPLYLAGLLADSAAAGAERAVPRVALPIWALPGVLTLSPCPVAVRLDDARIGCNPGGEPGATLTAGALAALPAAGLTIVFPPTPLPPLPCLLPVRFRRSVVPVAEWRRLEALAQLTYVPATDHSRRTGAGAGLLDDD